MVAAAVVLRTTQFTTRIGDSKRLSARQRLRAFQEILVRADVGLGIVCAEEIDRLNILQSSLLAMQQAVLDLPSLPDVVLVDGPYAPPLPIPCQPMIHGDARNEVIGCASIVAKVVRDELMTFYHRLMPRYGFLRHKGYGTLEHRRALIRLGPSAMHRLSFRPVADCVEAARPATRATSGATTIEVVAECRACERPASPAGTVPARSGAPPSRDVSVHAPHATGILHRT